MNYFGPQRPTSSDTRKRVVFKIPLKASPGLVIRRMPMTQVAHGRIELRLDRDRTAEEFARLRETWLGETRNLSSVDRKILNESYQRIIGMGRRALPHIFRALRANTEFWFPALFSITGTDPIPPEAVGDIDAMRDLWLEWGDQHGYPQS